MNGNVVSSTAIRDAVQGGDFVRAREMLGRDYTILGTVVHGEAVGNKIGFPTANLSAHSEQFPPNGVYLAEASVQDKAYDGVINLGVRPTVARGEPQRTLEIHLLDFDRDIYGEEIEVRFLQYLRSEQKFGSIDALKQKIETDVRQARELCQMDDTQPKTITQARTAVDQWRDRKERQIARALRALLSDSDRSPQLSQPP